jgi:3-isopropylmalate/(R)-2-methylmalate dehydratase small subunit
MNDATRTIVRGPALAVRGHDIDTDRIIPARFLKCVVFDGLGAHVFEDDRAQERARGNVHPFDDPRHAGARILLVNRNFGCGSSREHAPQAIMRWGSGIGAIVGESFAEIFFGNCVALGIPCLTADAVAIGQLMDLCARDPAAPFEVDLPKREVRAGTLTVRVDMPEGARQQLIDGRWDSTGELLAATADVRRVAAGLPYFTGWS